MVVQIEIVTRTLGSAARFCAFGEAVRTADGVSVEYPTDGDISTLEIILDRAVMRRRGLQSLDAVFSAGETTSFRISFQNHVSELSVFTSACKSHFSGSDIFLRLNYELGLSPSQKFSLKIHIKVLSEEL